MYIKGFKIFNSKLQNRYGFTFEVGKKYHCDGAIKFGIYGNGFHFCKNLEDTFRYAEDPNKSLVASVIGSGEIKESWDDYYGYYDLYCAEYLEIIRVLSREDILQMAKNMHSMQLSRLLMFLKFTEEELEELQITDFATLNVVEYYQRENTKVYEKNHVSKRIK